MNEIIDKCDFELFELIDKYIPGWYHVNSLKDFSLLYVGLEAKDYIGIDRSVILKKGVQFLHEYVHPISGKYASFLLTELIKGNLKTDTIRFRQALKNHGTDTYKLLNSQTKLIIDKQLLVSISTPCNNRTYNLKEINEILESYSHFLSVYTDFKNLSKELLDIINKKLLGWEIKDFITNYKLSEDAVKTRYEKIRDALNLNSMKELDNLYPIFMENNLLEY